MTDNTEPSKEGDTSQGPGVVDEAEAKPLDSIDTPRALTEAQIRAANQIVELRARYAGWLLRAMWLQVLVADALVIWVGVKTDWSSGTEAYTAWLTAAVIQIVALVLAITKFLFSKEALVFMEPETAARPAKKPGRLKSMWAALRGKG